MGNDICSVDGCEALAHTRGMCPSHEHRMRRYGDPNGGGRFRKGVSKCDVYGCDRPYEAGGYCKLHRARFQSTGNPFRPCATCGKDCDGRAAYCSEECRPECSEDGCVKPATSRGYCSTHYQDWRHGGRSYRWATDLVCVVCGRDTEPGSGNRKYCSGACAQIWHRNDGSPPPMQLSCVRCGTAIDMSQRGKSGRKKRSDVKLCDRCKTRHTLRHKTSVMEVVNASGSICGICGAAVDMDLRHPDIDSPSVDHILPRAHGGSDDLENLQVAHLQCNQLKHATSNFVIGPRSGRKGGRRRGQ